jgi:glycosyltransferase involved in cell wall biosynthesis
VSEKVLIVSDEIGLGYKRGIYHYTRSLVKAIKLEREIGLLTQAYFSNADEIVDSLENPSFYFREKNTRKKLWFNYIKYILNTQHDFEKVINHKESKEEFGFDYFLNKPAFYRYNNIYMKITGMGLNNIDNNFLDKNDIVITSSPVSIKSEKNKVIQTLHDVFPMIDTVYYQNTFQRKLQGLKVADKIIAMSKYTRDSFLSFYPHLEDRVEVVYQAISIDSLLIKRCQNYFINQEVLNKFNLKEKKYMFFVGAIEFRKNIHNLIKAFKIATLKNQELKLVFAGRADDKKYLNDYDLMKYKLDLQEEQIKFIGEITDIEKVCLIKNSRAFLFPSLLEGFGIPVVEAQTLGVPVLTANNSALSEVAEDSALVVNNAEDIEELIEGIKKLWEDDEYCSHLINKGFDNIERFSFENFANDVNSLIKSI